MNKESFWIIKDGKRVPRYPRVPAAEQTTSTVVNGLTLQHVATKAYTFTVAQVKHLCTADNLGGHPLTRKQGKELIKSLARENRFELFGSFAPYTITFNGYGQLKSMQLADGGRNILPAEIFEILEDVYLTTKTT